MMCTDTSVTGWYQLIISANKYISQALKYMPLNEVNGAEFLFVLCGCFHAIVDCAFGLQVYSIMCHIVWDSHWSWSWLSLGQHCFYIPHINSDSFLSPLIHTSLWYVKKTNRLDSDERGKLKWWPNIYLFIFLNCVYCLSACTRSLTCQIMIFLSSLTHSEYQNISHASSETESVPKACK